MARSSERMWVRSINNYRTASWYPCLPDSSQSWGPLLFSSFFVRRWIPGRLEDSYRSTSWVIVDLPRFSCGCNVVFAGCFGTVLRFGGRKWAFTPLQSFCTCRFSFVGSLQSVGLSSELLKGFILKLFPAGSCESGVILPRSLLKGDSGRGEPKRTVRKSTSREG